MTSEVDCTGLRESQVLVALFNHAKPIGMGMIDYKPEDMTDKEALFYLEQTKYFDYIDGRRLKIDFARFPKIDSTQYDRKQGGNGTMQKIIDNLKHGLNHNDLLKTTSSIETK